MGCRLSKSAVEPRTITIKYSGCSNLSGSYLSPVQLAGGEHIVRNLNTESYHVVSLSSSTYGSLRFDSNVGEERTRASSGIMGNVTSENASSRSGNTEDVKPLKGPSYKQVETINMWDLMEGIEDEKAALHVLRDLMGKPKVSGHDTGKSSPRVSTIYRTLEDVDSVLEVRRSLSPDYRFRRGSSMDSVSDVKSGISSAMLQKRRCRAMQISQEVIEDLDDLRRKNLSRSQEFNFSGRRNRSQSQKSNSTGRSDVSRSQEFNSTARRNLSRSQDLDSIRSINLTRNEEHDSRRIRNLSRSQDFTRPPSAKPKGVATRHSSEILRTVQTKDERRIALSKPDVVLRSPMLRGLCGHERFVSSDAINIEIRNKPLLQGQAQPVAEWRTTLPSAAGSTKASMNLKSPERRTGKVLEPRVASAVAALSRLGEQRSSSIARSVSEREAEVFQDQSSNLAEANHSVSKIPAYGSVATIADNTKLIVSQEHDQDGRKMPSVKKQNDRSPESASTTATSSLKEQRASIISSYSNASFKKQACEHSSAPQDTCSQGEGESLLDDPISSGYELVTKAEVAEAVLRSGSSSANQSRQSYATINSTSDTKTDKNTSWSLGRDSPPLDPELLASFEEALEMFTTDDWCTVRIGKNDDVAVTSGSTSNLDSPSWLRESVDLLPNNPAGKGKLNRFKILKNHVEEPHVPAQPKKIASSKIAPFEEQKIVTKTNPLDAFEKKCPPGGEARCVLYTTSLRGIRKTFEDCSRTRRILQYFNVQIDERDIAMHAEFRQEVNDLVGRAAAVPRLFIRGRYIGGGEEVVQLSEEGTLSALLEDLPMQVSHAVCDGCGGVRFVPCSTCCGSCKVVTEEGGVACCEECNENGLCRCPLCL